MPDAPSATSATTSSATPATSTPPAAAPASAPSIARPRPRLGRVLADARAESRRAETSRYLLLLAPSALRRAIRAHPRRRRRRIETDVPETATRVVVLYRVSNGVRAAGRSQTRGPALDARFDVQVRQSLPFMDFSSAKWEMLVAVRNFFRDAAPDQSVYDELLVVRPPKRIVGGLTLKF